jgi:5-methylcytosine-specific restriction endonuclease McrA
MRKESGKTKILNEYKKRLGAWIHNQELRIISGANDTPRTIRTLRDNEGWQIEVRGDGYSRLISLEKGEPKGKRTALSRKLRFEVFHRDGYRCQACGRGSQENVQLRVDHIIPVDWGGKTELDNLQTLCEECNSGKKAWVGGQPPKVMKEILAHPTIEERIETLFDVFPDQDIQASLIQMVSKGSLDWQRALRKVRKRTGKKILPNRKKRSYRYYKSKE